MGPQYWYNQEHKTIMLAYSGPDSTLNSRPGDSSFKNLRTRRAHILPVAGLCFKHVHIPVWNLEPESHGTVERLWMLWDYGPKKTHKHKDPALRIENPRRGGLQKPWVFEASSCLFGLLGPYGQLRKLTACLELMHCAQQSRSLDSNVGPLWYKYFSRIPQIICIS